jgi:tetratricopeptide (TPR) repeat protein
MIIKAMRYRKTGRADALKRKLIPIVRKSRAKENFNKSIKEIDKLIAEQSYFTAQDKIYQLLEDVKDNTKKASLNKRLSNVQRKLQSRIASLYSQGETAYRDEDYKKAIKLFREVYRIDADYKEVETYLDKSKQKQELLDSY